MSSYHLCCWQRHPVKQSSNPIQHLLSSDPSFLQLHRVGYSMSLKLKATLVESCKLVCCKIVSLEHERSIQHTFPCKDYRTGPCTLHRALLVAQRCGRQNLWCSGFSRLQVSLRGFESISSKQVKFELPLAYLIENQAQVLVFCLSSVNRIGVESQGRCKLQQWQKVCTSTC